MHHSGFAQYIGDLACSGFASLVGDSVAIVGDLVAS